MGTGFLADLAMRHSIVGVLASKRGCSHLPPAQTLRVELVNDGPTSCGFSASVLEDPQQWVRIQVSVFAPSERGFLGWS